MKSIFAHTYGLLLAGTLGAAGLVSSCNYLDVVPPEQPDMSDATKTYELNLNFLYSCYSGVHNPINATDIESAADEWVLPPLWNLNHRKILYNLAVPEDLNKYTWVYREVMRRVGQCYLFLEELPDAQGATEEDKREWTAEVDFLLGYYHMQLLTLYGPCMITEGLIAEDADPTTYPGRSHFDYCVDWIVAKFDKAAEVLPASRKNEGWGRATSTMAKALKARLLLYAASPLWNGSFPFPDWRNKTYETPGYGLELVSHTYDPAKWERARTACQEALDFALANGYELYNNLEQNDDEDVALPYVPGVDPSTAEGQEFLERVLLMRYLVTTRSNEGNNEIIWGYADQGDWIDRCMPTYVVMLYTGSPYGGQSGVAPLLSTTIRYFYTDNGKRPADDPDFVPEERWYESAGLGGERQDIINLNVHREPRFYAWIAFDGGDYMDKIAEGEPLRLHMRDSKQQGMNIARSSRNYSVTGYLAQKFIQPNMMINWIGQWINREAKPTTLIRLGELYLNLAECEAALGEVDKALSHINPIRLRAGIPALTPADITPSHTITDWVRNERFVELWGEGHRYHDVRRWMIAPETMEMGKRTGLNATEKEDPTFEEFNREVVLSEPYVWTNRMYLRPLFTDEVLTNRNMVQAPGY